MRKFEFLAMSALLIAMENPSSEMSQNRRVIMNINNEMAIVAGKGIFARSDSAKTKWLTRLDSIEQDLNTLLDDQNDRGLSEIQVNDLKDTQENLTEMRDMLKVE